jgi:hypothetical protein
MDFSNQYIMKNKDINQTKEDIKIKTKFRLESIKTFEEKFKQTDEEILDEIKLIYYYIKQVCSYKIFRFNYSYEDEEKILILNEKHIDIDLHNLDEDNIQMLFKFQKEKIGFKFWEYSKEYNKFMESFKFDF